MVHLQPIEHPSAWRTSEVASPGDMTVALEPRHINAFEAAYADIARQGLSIEQVGPEHFRVPEVAADLEEIYREVMRGRGIVLIDRLPVEHWPQVKSEIVYWGIASHFGTARSQSVLGDRIGYVADVGGKDPNERAYRNSLPLALHTDACDILCMLSLRKAAEGGRSHYASALAVHNILLEEHPECLELLYRGYRYHLFGENGPDEPPVTDYPIPVFSERDGIVSARIVAGYIYMAYEELGIEPAPAEREALDRFAEVALRPEVMLTFDLEPGQLLVSNNYTTLHARGGFEDPPAPEPGRLLLRLWLTAREEDRRPIDPVLDRFRKKGIVKRADVADTLYRGTATKILTPEVLRY